MRPLGRWIGWLRVLSVSPSKKGFSGMIFNQSGDSAILTWRAKCIGARAKSLVTVPGFSGRVLAVLSDVAYLSGRDGEILWLFREGVPLHGRGILLSFPLQCLHSGQGFFVEGHSLKIGRDLAIDLSRAVEWTPDPLRQWEIGPLVRVNDLVRQLLGTIAPEYQRRWARPGDSRPCFDRKRME